MTSTNKIQVIEYVAIDTSALQPLDTPTVYVCPVGNEMAAVNTPLIDTNAFNAADWIPSPIPAKLGFPLKAKAGSFYPDKPKSPVYSRQANSLFTNMDTNSDDFGKYTTAPIYGNMVIARCDGKSLDVKHVLVILAFIEDLVAPEMQRYGQSSETDKHGIRAATSYVNNPGNFRGFFEDYREGKLAVQGEDEEYYKGWVDLECPAQVDDTCACQACGEKKKGLMKCARCEMAHYCDRECQKEDWKDHKVVCKGLKMRGYLRKHGYV